MTRRAMRKLLFLFGAAIAVTAVVLLTFRLNERPLLDGATRIVPAKDWEWYDWKSKDVLLVSREGVPIEQIDVHTGSVSPLTHVARLFQPHLVNSVGELSPDKKWMHCDGVIGRVNSHEFFSFEGGSRTYPDPEREDEIGAWARDSRSWLSIRSNHNGVIRFGTLSVVGARHRSENLLPLDHHFSFPRIKGFLADGHILVEENARYGEECSQSGSCGPDNRSFELIECDLESKRLVRSWTFALPYLADVEETELSPSGEWIALQLRAARSSSPLSGFLRRLHIAPGPSVSLWIYRLDGREARCLGSLRLPGTGAASYEDSFCGLKWLPDGKQISFQLHEYLWTVPVE